LTEEIIQVGRRIANGSFGSFAEINDTPKAAVRAAPIEGEADLAIQQKRPFVSGKFSEPPRKLKRKVLAAPCRFGGGQG
jgi:hypothetical protein